MNSYILVPVVLYTAWAIYSGYKYVNGRYPWLEQPEIAHRICKYRRCYPNQYRCLWRSLGPTLSMVFWNR